MPALILAANSAEFLALTPTTLVLGGVFGNTKFGKGRLQGALAGIAAVAAIGAALAIAGIGLNHQQADTLIEPVDDVDGLDAVPDRTEVEKEATVKRDLVVSPEEVPERDASSSPAEQTSKDKGQEPELQSTVPRVQRSSKRVRRRDSPRKSPSTQPKEEVPEGYKDNPY